MTQKQQEALKMIKEWAAEEYKSRLNPGSSFERGINAAKWEIQTILNMAEL
jgi:hypothetical protein